MILVIDIGNTNIVFGGFKEKEIVFKSRIYTDKNLTVDQYVVQITNILKFYNLDKKIILDCAISCVVPQILDIMSKALFKITGKNPFVINFKSRLNFNILTDNPSQLGNDLIAGAAASINEFSPPIILIDMGTATTISVIDREYNYLGGLIIPGVKISLEALSKKATQLPFINLSQPPSIIGRNTIDCMKGGIIYFNAFAIDGIIEKIENELGESASIIATGGLAKDIVKFCNNRITYDEDLLLKGIYLIYNYNCRI